jgi:hypothetical protein
MMITASEMSIDSAVRDVAHRVWGTLAELRASFALGPDPDDILVERVRSRLGRCAAHPSAIDVDVSNGRVALK